MVRYNILYRQDSAYERRLKKTPHKYLKTWKTFNQLKQKF